jgi:hypothetical protein
MCSVDTVDCGDNKCLERHDRSVCLRWVGESEM